MKKMTKKATAAAMTKKAVMVGAWKKYREIKAEYGDANIGLCLKWAWKFTTAAMTWLKEFNGMTAEELDGRTAATIVYAAKKELGACTADYSERTFKIAFERYMIGTEFRDIKQDTLLYVWQYISTHDYNAEAAEREAIGLEPRTLSSIFYGAAKNALRKQKTLYKQLAKNCAVTHYTDDNGIDRDIIDNISGGKACGSPEAETIRRDFMWCISHDKIDIQIALLLERGVFISDIATRLEISRQAITKRLTVMRKKAAEYMQK